MVVTGDGLPEPVRRASPAAPTRWRRGCASCSRSLPPSSGCRRTALGVHAAPQDEHRQRRRARAARTPSAGVGRPDARRRRPTAPPPSHRARRRPSSACTTCHGTTRSARTRREPGAVRRSQDRGRRVRTAGSRRRGTGGEAGAGRQRRRGRRRPRRVAKRSRNSAVARAGWKPMARYVGTVATSGRVSAPWPAPTSSYEVAVGRRPASATIVAAQAAIELGGTPSEVAGRPRRTMNHAGCSCA